MANQVAFSDLGESILASDPQKEAQFKAEAFFYFVHLGYFHLVRAFWPSFMQRRLRIFAEMGVPLSFKGG